MNDHTRNHCLLVLSLAAGCVDAIAFLQSGAFPANMTGNSVVLGLALARANADHVAVSFLALGGFSLGVLLAAWFMALEKEEQKWTRTISVILAAAGFILLGAVVGLKFLQPSEFSWLLVPSAVAMGMQSTAVLSLGVAGVSTTVITGTLTTGLARMVKKFRQPKPAKNESVPGHWLPILSWLFYFGGALLAGFQSAYAQEWILFVPGLLLIGVGSLAFRSRAE